MDINKEKNYKFINCITVDKNDNYLGIKNIEECHTYPGILHRAFSIIIYNKENKLLLQQRSKTKYTFPLHWTNSVCSHPRSEKYSIKKYASIRIYEELGIKVIEKELQFIKKIRYKAKSDYLWCENEMDYLFICKIDINIKDLKINKNEIETVKFFSVQEINDMLNNKILFSPWFRFLSNNLDLNYHKIMNVSDKIINIGDLSKYTNDKKYLLNYPYYYINSNSGKKLRDIIIDSINIYFQIDKKYLEMIKKLLNEIHNSSLIIDDIQDNSVYRRGAKCAHILYGIPLTFNAALFQIIESIYKTPKNMRDIFLQHLMELIEGQGEDIYFTENGYIPSLKEYLEMIKKKTASLFTLPLEMVSCIAKKKDNTEKYLNLYKQIGIYFQKRDDYINIVSISYWKKKGFFQDFTEKKYGYPLVLYCSKYKKYFYKENQDFTDKYQLYLELHKSGFLQEIYEILLLEYQEIKKKSVENKLLNNIIIPHIFIEKPILYSEQECLKYHKTN